MIVLFILESYMQKIKKILAAGFLLVPFMALPAFADVTKEKNRSDQKPDITEDKYFAKFQATYIGQLKPALRHLIRGPIACFPNERRVTLEASRLSLGIGLGQVESSTSTPK